MQARLRKLWSELADTFWLIPALLTIACIGGAVELVDIDRSGRVPEWLVENAWVYTGGGTGARTLLGAVASSTIGVAGTVFSITIAALSLAAGQMGPRLLRNFTHDRGVQITLGTFLGTFSYALMVLRSVRTQDEGAFTPQLSLTVSLVLAFVCVATLVYFVGHMASRINVDTVVGLVSDDVRSALRRLTSKDRQPVPPDDDFWTKAVVIRDRRRGYLQELDAEALAEWAAHHGVVIKLLVRPGDFVFPGAAIALTNSAAEGASDAIKRTTALGETRVSTSDIEYAVRQLVEVAVRALSPGINDPHTAISVLDRLGASLCDVALVQLVTGVHRVDNEVALVVPSVDYDGLTNAMFHLIRQNGSGSTAILIRMMEILTAVVSCEGDAIRIRTLGRHADLVLGDAERTVSTPSDLHDIRQRHAVFERSSRRATAGLHSPIHFATS